MRIAVITDQFPAVSETWVTREVNALQQAGHEVIVIARQINPADAFKACTQIQVALSAYPVIAALQCVWAWVKTFPAHSLFAEDKSCFSLGERFKRLFRYARIKTLSFDDVHVHFGSVGAQYDFIPKTHGCPYTVTFHGYDLRRGERDGGARYQHLFAAADTIIAISAYTRDKLIDFGCPPEKIKQEPLGVDTDLFHPSEKKSVNATIQILTVARLVSEKNLTLAIQVVARIMKDNPRLSIRYRIIGEGPERRKLEACAAECGIEVAMPGAMTPAQIADEMRDADIFLLSSKHEVAPVVIAEALATHLPVVATDVGAVAEMVNKENGRVVPPDDPIAMQQAIQKLLPPNS